MQVNADVNPMASRIYITQVSLQDIRVQFMKLCDQTYGRRRAIILCFVCAIVSGLARDVRGSDFSVQPFVDQFCIRCHGSEEPSGNVELHEIGTVVDGRLDTLQDVMHAIGDRVMPPEGELQPTESQRAEFISWCRTQLSRVTERPGDFRIRRLSAHEYRNTMRSLFGFDLEVALVDAEQNFSEKSLVLKLMPPDPPGASGFANDTHGQAITRVGWDRYLYFADFAINQLIRSPNRREQLEAYTGPVGDGGLTSGQAEQLIRRFIVQAWRRDVSEEVVDRFLISCRIKTGEKLLNALTIELQTILTSPQFLYRGVLVDPVASESVPVDDFELAERLSYFLWASMPDEELLALARAGTLSEDIEFKRQVNRMLDSPKARSLTEDFAREWLKIGEIHQVDNRVIFADALQNQPYEFIHYLIADDRPLMELIDSDITFLNVHLVSFYTAEKHQLAKYDKPQGIEKVSLPLQQVRLENTPGRGGILTMPGVLAMNHGPISRGVWMLEWIIGDELGEPPANVEPVKAKIGDKRSFRERFSQHRSDVTCAACHNRIDPLGFALQAYDQDGAYYLADDYATQRLGKRNKRKSAQLPSPRELDSSGKLPTGERFNDLEELKQILMGSYRERIVRNMVRQMLAYALCRPLEMYDQPTVDRLTTELANPGATWRDLIHGVTNSLPFRNAYFLPNHAEVTNDVHTH